MLQVLHLLDAAADLQSARGAEALARNARGEFHVIHRTIGRGGDYRSAAHAAMSLRFCRGRNFDLIHAWDTVALAPAITSGLPVVFSPSAPPPAATGAWLRAAIALRSIELACASMAERAAYLSRGIAATCCPVIAPSIDASRIPIGRNPPLREQLGFSRDDFVLLPLGESSLAAGHRLAFHAASILHVMDPRYRLLLWGRGGEAQAIAAMGPKLHQPRLVVVAERVLGRPVEFEELPGAADIGLVTPRALAPVLSWGIAMTAGLPILATDTPQTRELFAAATASLVPLPGPRALAQRVLNLAEDPLQQRKMSEASVAAARAQFDSRRFSGDYSTLYSRLESSRRPIVLAGVTRSMRRRTASPAFTAGPSK